MFLIITSNDVTIKQLHREVRTKDHTIVYCSRQIVQCHRCQGWSHVTSNCYNKPACLKCAGDHFTRDCTKEKTTPAKCVNCSGTHPANYTQCPEYLKSLERSLEKKISRYSANTHETIKKTFKEAPIPEYNIWEKKKEEARQQTVSEKENLEAPESSQTQARNQNNTIGIFAQIKNQIEILNSHINLNEFLKSLTKLNSQLKNSNEPS